MARQKKPVHRVQMTEGKRNIFHQLLDEYDIQTTEDIQNTEPSAIRLKAIMNNIRKSWLFWIQNASDLFEQEYKVLIEIVELWNRLSDTQQEATYFRE